MENEKKIEKQKQKHATKLIHANNRDNSICTERELPFFLVSEDRTSKMPLPARNIQSSESTNCDSPLLLSDYTTPF
jgi:hypothetical protein